jgi:uncharacterized protein
MTVLDRLAELAARVDGFFDQVHARRRADMMCAAGCHDCCQPGLTVTAIEAAAIRAHLAAMPAAARDALRARRDGARCAALDDGGRCSIYPARPLICRSHGVSIRMADRRGLPVVETCPKNFTARAAGPAEILDQGTLSTILAALDAAHAAAQGGDRERVAIADLLGE